MVSKQKETDDRYWSDYTALQHFKHQLLKCYLEGWFPKISKYNPRILYVDTHAGRGKYKTGEEGSPLIALKSLLNHKARDFILKNTEVIFLFLENNLDNAKALKNSLKELTNIPPQISHKVIEEEFSTKLSQGLDELAKGGKKLAPSFFFLDPYNYQLSMELMKKILSNPRSEILVNFMTRYVGLAIEKNQEENLNLLFDSDIWKELRFSQMQDWILESDWRLTHVRTILSKLKDDKLISASDFPGRLYFNEKTNPLIDFHF